MSERVRRTLGVDGIDESFTIQVDTSLAPIDAARYGLALRTYGISPDENMECYSKNELIALKKAISWALSYKEPE